MSDSEQNNNDKQNVKVKVDAETYLNVTLAKYDDDIAEAEMIVQRAKLRVAELKKEKSKVLIDYHYNIIKEAQMKQEKDEQMKKEIIDEIKSGKAEVDTSKLVSDVKDDVKDKK